MIYPVLHQKASLVEGIQTLITPQEKNKNENENNEVTIKYNSIDKTKAKKHNHHPKISYVNLIQSLIPLQTTYSNTGLCTNLISKPSSL